MIKNTLLQKMFFLLAMLCFGLLTFINILELVFVNLKEYLEYFNRINHKVYILYFMIFLLLAFIAGSIILKKLRLKSYFHINHPVVIAVLLFVISSAVKLAFVFVVKTSQYSDFQLFYWVTVEIAKKVPKYLSQPYFSIWAYQVGFPAAMSPIAKIFGLKILPLIVANCLFMSITNVLIYLISRQYVSERISRIGSFAFAFLPFVLSTSSVYTNQHLAAMLFYAGLYILTFKKSFTIKRSVAAGLFFAVGNMIRPEAILFVISLFGLMLLVNLNKSSLGKLNIRMSIRTTFLPITCAILVYFAGMSMISQFFILSGLNPEGLANNFPLYKFVVGFNHESTGTFSQKDADYLFESEYFRENPDARDQEALRLIRERISVSPGKLAELFSKKVKIMWSCNPSWYPSFTGMDMDKKVSILTLGIPLRMLLNGFASLDFLFYIAVFSICGISMFNAFRSSENSIITLLSAMIFVTAFFVFLLIEVQHRYGYFVFPSLFILACSGLDSLFDKKKADSTKMAVSFTFR